MIVIYILLPKPIDGLLILVYLLQTLPRPNNMWLAIGIDQHLGRLGKAVVVLGTHPGAVRAAAIHHADVPNGRRPQLPLSQALGLAGEGGHEIATLAAVADDDDGLGVGADVGALAAPGEDGEGMDGPVQAGAEDVGHAGIELEEGVAAVAGRDDLVLDGADEGTGVGDEVRAGFDLELNLSAGVVRKVAKHLRDGGANLLQVRGGLSRIPPDLVPAAEVAGRDGVPNLAERQTLGRHRLPDGGIGSRSDVGVDPLDDQTVFGDHVGDGAVRNKFVPDAEGGRGSSDVGLGETRGRGGESTGTDAGVDADADDLPLAGVVLTDALDLRQGAGVDLDAQVHQFGKVGGQLLRRQRYVLGRNTGLHGTPDLVAARRIDVDAPGMEVGQDGAVGAGLHGIPDREAVGVGEGQAVVGELLELGKAVGVQRGSDGVDGGPGRFGAEEGRRRGDGDRILEGGHAEGRR